MIGLLFLGLFAPAATPKPIVDRIAAASRAAMADPEFQKVLTDLRPRSNLQFQFRKGQAVHGRGDRALGAGGEGLGFKVE